MSGGRVARARRGATGLLAGAGPRPALRRPRLGLPARPAVRLGGPASPRCTSTTGCAPRRTATRRTAGRSATRSGVPLAVERAARRRQPATCRPGRATSATRPRRALAAARLIAAGHTATDQVETVLYRLAASPGRRALLGMPARAGRLVRPLLGVTPRGDGRLLRGPRPGLARGREQRRRFARGGRLRCRRCARSTRRPRRTSCARAESARRGRGPRRGGGGRAPRSSTRWRRCRPPWRAWRSRDGGRPRAVPLAARRRHPGALARHGTAALDLGGGRARGRRVRAAADRAARRPVAAGAGGPARARADRLWHGAADVRARAGPRRGRRDAGRGGARAGARGAAVARGRPDAAAGPRREPARCRTCSPTARSPARAAPTSPWSSRDGEIVWVPGVATGERFGVTPGTRDRVRLAWTPDARGAR